MNGLHVALVNWSPGDGIAQAIAAELIELGYQVSQFLHTDPIPPDADVVFSYAPYGPFLPLARRVADRKRGRRPVLVHWNTEGMPDPREPWFFTNLFSSLRSRLGRLAHEPNGDVRPAFRRQPLSWLNNRFIRYRYVGDYRFAHQQGWLDVYADSSAVYARVHKAHGLPTVEAYWGGIPTWSADMHLERDIDVLWMGKYGSSRRREILSVTRRQLEAEGFKVHMADNEENPFVFGDERTRMLNRSKIVVNVTRTWYDDNFSRFAIAAPNRALVVSERMLDHCPPVRPGRHYVACDAGDLPATIARYLRDDAAREEIVANAYALFTGELTFNKSIAAIMAAAEKALEPDRQAVAA